MDDTDTIAAVSTAQGRAERAIVRLSGPEAFAIAGGVFEGEGPVDWTAPFRLWRGHAVCRGARLPALLYVMPAPRSYTRQDVAELHVPGAPVIVDMVLRALFDARPGGLRAAGPGEFTRRAFLSGRIDLAQAEAVLAVIRAAGESELRGAVRMLEGLPARRLRAAQDRLTSLRAEVEAALDFGDQDIAMIPADRVAETLSDIASEVGELLGRDDAPTGEAGTVAVAIAGRPNAGKSSLLNALAGQRRAIVTALPGTTRDAVSVDLTLDGVAVRLIDTAGIAEFDSHLEREAADRARRVLDSARLVLFVHDRTAEAGPDELRLLESVGPDRTLVVLSKGDLPGKLSAESLVLLSQPWRVVTVSARTGAGLDQLRRWLVETVRGGRVDLSNRGALVSQRQREAARGAARALADAQACLSDGGGYELVALLLREASERLADITGHVAPEAVLDHVFSRFCIGK